MFFTKSEPIQATLNCCSCEILICHSEHCWVKKQRETEQKKHHETYLPLYTSSEICDHIISATSYTLVMCNDTSKSDC